MAELAYIALGSNLGNRAGFLASARAAMSLLAGSRITAATEVIETLPFGPVVQGPYLNQMVALQTELRPHALLGRLQGVERTLGRVRTIRWGPRTIDLDIVRFATESVQSPTLTLPHPGLVDREFWQRQLRELDALVEAGA